MLHSSSKTHHNMKPTAIWSDTFLWLRTGCSFNVQMCGYCTTRPLNKRERTLQVSQLPPARNLAACLPQPASAQPASCLLATPIVLTWASATSLLLHWAPETFCSLVGLHFAFRLALPLKKLAILSFHSPNVRLRSDLKCKVSPNTNISCIWALFQTQLLATPSRQQLIFAVFLPVMSS